jgi:hypothetical protein
LFYGRDNIKEVLFSSAQGDAGAGAGRVSEQSFPEGELLDISAAADFLSISTKTVRRYISSGKVRARKVRNVWFCPRAELEKLIEKESPPAAAAIPALAETMPVLLELKDALVQLNKRIGAIDDRLFLISQDRELRKIHSEPSPEETQEIEYAKADNLKLIDEQQRIKKEIADLRQNGVKDIQLLKSKADEIESLKSRIASNERGLNLLRAEIAQKDESLARKEDTIRDLKRKNEDLEQEFTAIKSGKKVGFLGSLRIPGPVPDKKAGAPE